MAQGITLRLVNVDADLPPKLLRAVGWQAMEFITQKYPALGDITVEVWDTTDFDYGKGDGV